MAFRLRFPLVRQFSDIQTNFADVEAWLRSTTNAAKGARVQLTTGHDVGNNNLSVVQFDTEVFDLDGMVDLAANKRITAVTAGLYVATSSVGWAGDATGRRRSIIRKNGTTTVAEASLPPTPSATTTFVPAAGHVQMVAGDYLELLVEQNSGGVLALLTGTSFGTSYQGA